MYDTRLLDHYHHPHHRGHCDSATHTAESINDSCGDRVRVELRINAEGQIECAAFDGDGCAISAAAADLLMEHIIQSPRTELEKMDAHAMLELIGIPLSPPRIKCALLALETAQRALQSTRS